MDFSYLKPLKTIKIHLESQIKPSQDCRIPGISENPDNIIIDGSGQDSAEPDLAALLSQADRLATGYDYDGAIALLSGNTQYSATQEVTDAIAGYEAVKATLVEVDVSQVTHVFFHSLIMDTAKAFDGDNRSKGYNSVMTTKDEFLKILNEMYNRGFVLVRLHDMAYETTDENGQTVMKKGSIMLPEGKKPFVMSQDDVCYYEYMENDGFASRIVIGDNGKPTCEMKLEDDHIHRIV